MAFKTTKENQVLIKSLTDKFSFKNEAAIARIAINYTLQLDKKFCKIPPTSAGNI